MSAEPNPFEPPSYWSAEQTKRVSSGLRWQLVGLSVLLVWCLAQVYFFIAEFPELCAEVKQRKGAMPANLHRAWKTVSYVSHCWFVIAFLVSFVVGFSEWYFKGGSKRKARFIIGCLIGGVSGLFTLWVVWEVVVAMY